MCCCFLFKPCGDNGCSLLLSILWIRVNQTHFKGLLLSSSLFLWIKCLSSHGHPLVLYEGVSYIWWSFLNHTVTCASCYPYIFCENKWIEHVLSSYSLQFLCESFSPCGWFVSKLRCKSLIHVDELFPLFYLHSNKMEVFKE